MAAEKGKAAENKAGKTLTESWDYTLAFSVVYQFEIRLAPATG
jgi:hypothetical protein